jgi:transposase InsO family protein
LSEQAISQYAKRQSLKMSYYLELRCLVLEYRKSHPGSGLRRIYDQLSPSGVGRDRFIQTMQDMGMDLRRKKNSRRTTIPGFLRFPNLIQGMLVWRENQVWQTDITYYTIRLDTYYLIFIIDVYTKYIKSYKVSKSLHAYHNLNCLSQAIKANKANVKGLIHHSDRGVQFTSIEYLELLMNNDIHISMGEKGQDNAYAERINGTIKNEYLNYRKIESFDQLKRWTKQAVFHYNTVRHHKHLPKGMSPTDFTEKLLTLSYQERPKVIIYADGNNAIREDYVFLNSITKKDRQAHICPIKVN